MTPPPLTPTGERQVAPTLDGIRRDHVARYEFAARHPAQVREVLDVGCGVGYGAHVLASAGLLVTAFDVSPEAIDYAREHYRHERASYLIRDCTEGIGRRYDAAVVFEVIEHVADPAPMLSNLADWCKVLFASVPNEDAMPWHPGLVHHYRHYRPAELAGLLDATGWEAVEWHGQEGPESEVTPIPHGRTLVVVARSLRC